jgi:hypothetical protein
MEESKSVAAGFPLEQNKLPEPIGSHHNQANW